MNVLAKVPLPGTREDPRYPDSNGRFMGDTDYHNLAAILLRQALEDYFASRPDVYVASNLVMYYKEGDARCRRDPDVLVAKGVGKHQRRSFRVWEEGQLPCTLFEIASRRTWRWDIKNKRDLYARIGIKEYFLFDPEGEYLPEVLLGFRSVKGLPKAMKPAEDGSLVSKELGLRLVPEGELLRLIDIATGQPVLTRDERAEELEAEVKRLRRMLNERN